MYKKGNKIDEMFESHKIGDIDCDVDICNADSGFWQNIVPIECPCGGIIHGFGGTNFDDDMGPFELAQCDKCFGYYHIDDLI